MFSQAELTFFPLLILAFFGFNAIYRSNLKGVKYIAGAVLLFSILFFTIQSSIAGLGFLGAALKFLAGASISLYLLNTKPVKNSLFMLVVVLILALESRIIAFPGIESLNILTWLFALAAGYSGYRIFAILKPLQSIPMSARIITAIALSVSVLMNVNATIIMPVGTFSIVNLLCFKYIFALGLIVGHILGQMERSRRMQLPAQIPIEIKQKKQTVG